MDFLQRWSKSESNTKFNSEEFGDFVLLESATTRHNSFLKAYDELNATREITDHSTIDISVVSKKYYDAKIAEHGNDPDWILGGESKDCIEEAMHPDYLAAYKKGEHDMYRHEGRYKKPLTTTTPLRQLLQDGKTELFVVDGHDHFFYDLNGKKLFRPFYFDYIQTQISNKYFKLKRALEYLERIPQVSEAKIIEKPYYNQDINNQKAIEFKYTPKDEEEFQKLTHTKDAWNICSEVNKMLNLDQFRKEDDDE